MKSITTIIFCLIILNLNAQDWNGIPVPANPGTGNTWKLQETLSDDFNYDFNEVNQQSNFGNDKWYNFFHNGWDGPGTTYWKHDHVSVDGSDLIIRASRNPSTLKLGVPGVNAGCITSNNKVKFPVFVEANISVADIVLASDVWLLSPDDTQEIDIIECYGGDEQGNGFFSKFIHLSHHSFIRNPFTDYQPRDRNSWWTRSGIGSWGEYSWNNGDRLYTRVGVNWISPFHFEYYIDGELVRVLYDKAFATKNNGTWSYTYPTMTNGVLDNGSDGFQNAVVHATGTDYSFQTIQEASNTSLVSVIDPYNFQGGNGFTKEMDIIINVESQDWHVVAGRTPTDDQLNDPARNKMKVDWIRIYKPEDLLSTNDNDQSLSNIKIYPNPSQNIVSIEGLDKGNDFTFHIHDIRGTSYAIKKLNNNNSINIENLSSGIYFLTVINSVTENIQTLKLIKH